jgi:hypothetical protein
LNHLTWLSWVCHHNCRLLLPPGGLSPKPLIGCITHCLASAILQPRHKGPIKPELRAALLFEKPSDVLGIPVGLSYGCRAANAAGMPIERFQLVSSQAGSLRRHGYR